MKNGVASLHNILKDETRRKMVLLLNEKGHLSYTDFMRELEISNTGRLNYHLKEKMDNTCLAKRANLLGVCYLNFLRRIRNLRK